VNGKSLAQNIEDLQLPKTLKLAAVLAASLSRLWNSFRTPKGLGRQIFLALFA
jgi:hypothetical protein